MILPARFAALELRGYSALVLGVLVGSVLWFGELMLPLCVLSFLGVASFWEWMSLTRIALGWRVVGCALLMASGGAVIALWGCGVSAGVRVLLALSMVWWVGVLGLIVWPSWRRWAMHRAGAFFWVLSGGVTLFFSFCALQALLAMGAGLCGVVLVVITGESAAYGVGSCVGGWRLCSTLSPKKTVSGLIGGWVASFLVGRCYFFFSLPFLLLLYGASTLGDLYESLLKRRWGAKESGWLLPGHGGLLDRLDGFTAALPFAAVWWVWVL